MSRRSRIYASITKPKQQALEVFPLWVVETERVIDGSSNLAQELQGAPGIHRCSKNDLAKQILA